MYSDATSRQQKLIEKIRKGQHGSHYYFLWIKTFSVGNDEKRVSAYAKKIILITF